MATARTLYTIGQLAERTNVSTSLLRFYEREGLLRPERRSESGYRLYGRDAEKTLTFIRRAQRLGFSLEDIRLLLEGRAATARSGQGQLVVGLAQQRFLEIERRLTELLVLRHELELFLGDLTARIGGAAAGHARVYRELLEHVCRPHDSHAAKSSVTRLMKRLGCSLANVEREQIFAALRGRHVHVWREPQGYAVLVTQRDPAVAAAVRQLVDADAGCTAHVSLTLEETEEGSLLFAQGENAFLFAQLFLALEASEA